MYLNVIDSNVKCIKITERKSISMLNSLIISTFKVAVSLNRYYCNVSTMERIIESQLSSHCRSIAPRLVESRHKGQSGRIGVIGGSLEYTGAPYFSAISALKVGADLAHVFCTRDAATVIKSYSPELIVHPVLDDVDKTRDAIEWLHRLHVVVMGPGLGRDPSTFDAVTILINACRKLNKPLVIDADGLFLITQKPELIHNYPAGLILTPNIIEYERLFNSNEIKPEFLKPFGTKCIVIRKGREDVIFNSDKSTVCTVKGSGRRCGGQGDLLSGSVATFFSWSLDADQDQIPSELRTFTACYAACKLTRMCNAYAFKCHARSMTCSNMIQEIGNVFQDQFECESKCE